MSRGPRKLKVGVTLDFTNEQLVRGGADVVEDAKPFMLKALWGKLREDFPDGGFVLDESTVAWAEYDSNEMFMRNIRKVMVTGIAVEHDRGPVIESMMDVLGFKTGSTFRDRSGHVMVLDDGKLVSIHSLTRTWLVAVSVKIDAVFPLTFLWEPKVEMDTGEIYRAEYDPISGIPARVVDQMAAGMVMDSALIDGWL